MAAHSIATVHVNASSEYASDQTFALDDFQISQQPIRSG